MVGVLHDVQPLSRGTTKAKNVPCHSYCRLVDKMPVVFLLRAVSSIRANRGERGSRLARCGGVFRSSSRFPDSISKDIFVSDSRPIVLRKSLGDMRDLYAYVQLVVVQNLPTMETPRLRSMSAKQERSSTNLKLGRIGQMGRLVRALQSGELQ